jgi:hypothetical protein
MSNKKGGQGAKATSKQSRATDKLVKNTCESLATELKSLGIKWEPYMRLPFTTPGSKSGNKKKLTPDGGIFKDKNGKMIVAVEAKHQGKIGNAIERWYKNNMLIRAYGQSDISYVTIISGYIQDDGGMVDTLKPIHHGEYGSIDIFSANKNSLFRAETWSEDEIKQTLLECFEVLGYKQPNTNLGVCL